MKAESSIILKSAQEIQILREAGQILASIIEEVKCSLKSGMTTKEIDALAETAIKRKQVIPAFKGYRGFPGCACISVNNEVVHGIPSERVIKDGDIVSLDIGIIFKDYYSDTATTIPIGQVSSEIQQLLNVTRESLLIGIEKARVGNRLSDISHAIQVYVEANNLAIVRDFVGHGIGKSLHEDPEIPNYGPPNKGPVLKEDMVLAIEPMVNMGSWETKILSDGWTVATKDGQPSAHFEHSIAIAEEGPEILTKLK